MNENSCRNITKSILNLNIVLIASDLSSDDKDWRVSLHGTKLEQEQTGRALEEGRDLKELTIPTKSAGKIQFSMRCIKCYVI